MLKNKKTVIRHLDNEILKRKNNPYDKVNYEFFQDKKYDLFRNDEEVVRKAISIHPKCISFSELKNDRDFVFKATRDIDCYTFTYTKNNEHTKDKEIIFAAMDRKAFMFSFADEPIRYNEEYALKAVKMDGFNLEYVSDSMKNDKEVVLEALKNEPRAIEYVSDKIQELCKDKDPVKTLEAIIFAEKLQQNLTQKQEQKPTKKLKI